MNLQTFFDNFELLAEAPSGVQKLRELILQLAVMGKLAPQDPNDEPAQELLKEITAVKESLLQKGKIQQDKKFSPIIKTLPPLENPCNLEVD